MISTNKVISKDYFTRVDINVLVDDLQVEVKESDSIVIKLTCSNNLEDQINEFLIDHDVYEVSLTCIEDVLCINYMKQEILFLNNPSYVEVIGIYIIIPEGLDYKIINDEENKDN